MAITKQLEYVRSNEGVLTKKYNEKYLVISEKLEETPFDSLDEAYLFGMKEMGGGNFLLRKFSNNNSNVNIINQSITSL